MADGRDCLGRHSANPTTPDMSRRVCRVTDDIDPFNDKLQEWEDCNNYHRPDGALDGQTPFERLVAKTRARALAAS